MLLGLAKIISCPGGVVPFETELDLHEMTFGGCKPVSESVRAVGQVRNEAALIAARNNKSVVDFTDFNAAIDRIIGGLEKKSKITTDEEKRGISVHEAGHATVSWHLRYGDPLVKVTIVPRGKALGAAWYLPEERQLVPAQALLDKICSLMGGRAAEDLFIGQVATGSNHFN